MKHGFRRVLSCDTTQKYSGDADRVMLVWNSFQIAPAECYRNLYYPAKVVDLVVCADPNIQRTQLGERSLIYNFGAQSSDGGSDRPSSSR